MRKLDKRIEILTTFWFLIGLTILLLNDLFLKNYYNNWLTGKLSDFAGLFIFSLFFTTLLPNKKKLVFWLTAIIFIVWKSSYSQILINTWNSFNLFNITRVVDYSDLIALSILPLAYYIENIKEKLYSLKLTPLIPFLLSIFAFIATSKKKDNCFDHTKATYNIKHYSRDSLIQNLKHIGLNVSFSKYNNAKYDDEHSEIHNLNDSIKNLVILIRDFDNNNNTVEILLGCWNMNDEKINFKTSKNEKLYVKGVFEKRVIEKIERSFSTNKND